MQVYQAAVRLGAGEPVLFLHSYGPGTTAWITFHKTVGALSQHFPASLWNCRLRQDAPCGQPRGGTPCRLGPRSPCWTPSHRARIGSATRRAVSRRDPKERFGAGRPPACAARTRDGASARGKLRGARKGLSDAPAARSDRHQREEAEQRGEDQII